MSQKVKTIFFFSTVLKFWKVKKRDKKAGFQSISATIRTRQESHCLPYAGIFVTYLYFQHNLLIVSNQLTEPCSWENFFFILQVNQ